MTVGRKTADGHQRVVRHGHLPEREVMTGIGPVAVRQPHGHMARREPKGISMPLKILKKPSIPNLPDVVVSSTR